MYTSFNLVFIFDYRLEYSCPFSFLYLVNTVKSCLDPFSVEERTFLEEGLSVHSSLGIALTEVRHLIQGCAPFLRVAYIYGLNIVGYKCRTSFLKLRTK